MSKLEQAQKPYPLVIDFKRAEEICGGYHGMVRMLLDDLEGNEFDQNITILHSKVMLSASRGPFPDIETVITNISRKLSYACATQCFQVTQELVSLAKGTKKDQVINKYSEFLAAYKTLKIYLAFHLGKDLDVTKIEKHRKEVESQYKDLLKYQQINQAIKFEREQKTPMCSNECNLF